MRILSFFGVLLSACNSAPGPVTIALSPEAPLTTDAIEVVIIGESADPDAKSSVTYTYLWYRNNELQTDLDGTSIGSELTTKGEAWKVIVTPTDGELQGPPAAAEVQVRNTPPIATVSVSLETPLSTESVSAGAETSDADGDAVEVFFVWTLEGDSDRKIDGEELSSDETTKGEVWTVTVTPKDDEEDGEPATASVSIENVAPVVDSLELHPGDAFEDSTLEAVVETSDEDLDSVTLSYAWTVDGSVLPDATDRLLFHEQFDKHSVVSVTVTPNDGFVDGDSVTSEDKTIQNSPPTLTGASLTPTEIYESSTVYCEPEGYADLDGDTANYTYSWTVDGSDAGSTMDNLDGFYFDKGQAVACTVIPNDGEVDGDPATSASLTVGNTAPVATGVDISSGVSAYEADTLEAGSLTYTDDDGDSVTWNYSWSVDGSLVISGPTDTTLTGLYFSKGQSVTVTVTPNDGTDDGSSFTSVSTTILNSLPRVDSLILHNLDPAVNESIGTSETTSDDDGDDVSVTWSWAVNGTTLPGETEPGLIGSGQFQKGDVITCTATPYETNDPAVVGAPYSVDVTAVNAAPAAPGAVSLAPASPIEKQDDLLCTVDTEATDPDGDPIHYVFWWYVDTFLWTGTATDTSLTSTVAAADTTAGEAWICRAISYDDSDAGGSYTDATVTISANSPPAAPRISLGPSDPVEGQDDLVCTVETASTDAEGDPISYSFEWLVDGSAWNGTSADTALTSTVDGSETTAGEDWMCRVWPDDGWDTGDSAEVAVTVTADCASVEMDHAVTTSEIVVPMPDSLAGNTTFHAEMWMIQDHSTSAQQGLFAMGQEASTGCGGNSRFKISSMSSSGVYNGLALDVGCWANPDGGFSQVAVPAGQWVLVFHSWDSSTSHYRSGLVQGGVIQDTYFTGPTRNTTATDNIHLGYLPGYQPNHNGTLDGKIGMFRVYDRIPTETELLARGNPTYDASSDAGLLVDLRFDTGSLIDQTGNGHDATLVDATLATVCMITDGDGDGYAAWEDCDDDDGSLWGALGSADCDLGVCSSLELGTIGELVTVPIASDLDFGNDATLTRTIEGWAIEDQRPVAYPNFLVMKSDPAGGSGSNDSDYIVYSTSMGGPYITGFVWLTGPATDTCATQVVSLPAINTWYHFAVTIEATGANTGTKQIYINGVLQDSCTYAVKNAADSSQTVYLGGMYQWGSPAFSFDGLIDAIRISSTVRYTGGFSPAGHLEADADTIAAWSFAEGSGATVHDSSGSGHDGTITGGAWDDTCSLGERVLYNGQYYFISSDRVTYSEALAICDSMNLDPVKVESQAENDFLEGEASAVTIGMWLGLTDDVTEGNWVWPDGSTPSYTHWEGSEGNDGSSVNCASLMQHNGQWQDLSCTATKLAVCE